jgi:hypothetical protein
MKRRRRMYELTFSFRSSRSSLSSRSSCSSVSTVVDIVIVDVVILFRPNCIDRVEEEEE